MGLNIYVMKIGDALENHPDWDSSRYAGDRDLPSIMKAVAGIDHLEDPGYGNRNDWYWRPTDFKALRKVAETTPYPERILLLAEILEHNPDYWVYLSI